MKYLIFLIPFILLFGCSEIFDTGTDYHTEYSDYDPDYIIELPNSPYDFNGTFIFLSTITFTTIKNKKDNAEYWQTPIETFNLKTGDCEDKAIYFAYLLRKLRNVKCEIWSIKNITLNRWHIIAVYDDMYYGFNYTQDINGNIYYDTTDYLTDNDDFIIRDIYNYGTALYYAEYIK